MAKELKISNKKTDTEPTSASKKETFDKAVNDSVNAMSEYKKRSWDLGAKFKSIMESEVLVENKTILLKNLESETLMQLSQLATEINNDSVIQEDSVGSVALIQLVMKMLILQKDKINQLKFTIEKLETDLKNLKNKDETTDAI